MVARTRLPLAAIGAAMLAVWSAPGRAASQPLFRSGVEVVRIDVSVTRGGTPVAGLTRDNFEVIDNGVAQAVGSVAQTEAPLTLMLVLDTSGSLVGERLLALTDAARGLVRALRVSDRVGLLTFSQGVTLASLPTTNHDGVLSSLDRVTASGPTAWRDALFVGLHLVEPDVDSRPVLLLFSDGGDTASWLEAAAVEEVVRRSRTVVHLVELAAPARRVWDSFGRRLGMRAGSRSLARAVAAGGGRQWSATAPSELRRLFAIALDELRGRYLLTYTPSTSSSPGWHDVQVRIKGVRAEVRARSGYLVPAR